MPDKHGKIDLALQRLAINYDNHNKQDERHFGDIKERLDRIESKLDMWSLKVAGIGGGMGILTTIIVLLITKVIG